MTDRRVWNTIAAGVCVAGALALAVQQTNAQETSSSLPTKGGWVTVTGCLQPGLQKKLVLVRPTIDHIATVPEAACNLAAGDGELMLELHNTKKYQIDGAMVGTWVEVNGLLEHIGKHDNAKNPREIHVRSSRAVPVVPPRAADVSQTRELPSDIAPPAAPSFAPRYEQPAATSGTREEAPVAVAATSGQLPKTASPIALMGLTSLLSLAGGFGLRLFWGPERD